MLSASSVQRLMNRNFVQSDVNVSSQGALNMLESSPSWLLIVEDEKRTLLSPGDLHVAANRALLSEDPIDLLNIPALRLDTSTIESKATLQQALDQMTECGIDALCVIADNQDIIGLLTRDQIETFYRKH